MKYFSVVAILFLALTLVSAQREKPGSCGRMKRELCQCAPNGPDECNDECTDDTECYGQRKCCTYVCKRVCTLPVLRPPPARQCPPQQEWDPCPPLKPATCVQPSLNVTRPNNIECNPSCVCRPGFVSTGDGRCIQQTQCPPAPQPPPPVCPGPHETYHSCFQGCQPSCANPNAIGCAVVGSDCVQGCYCGEGYVRNGVGRCVQRQACPPPVPLVAPPPPPTPACPSEQVFSLCKRECEATCAHPNPRGCFRRCQIGCFCRNGMVRDHFGNCVDRDACPKIVSIPPVCLGPYEKYEVCSKQCQRTCANPDNENCFTRCSTGCFCQDGYYRDESGICVTRDQCPLPTLPPPPPTPSIPVCENEHEEFFACYNQGCQRSCDNPTGSGCSNECRSGCYCRDGLLRNHLGQCVREYQCPTLGCGANEHFEECGPACPITCPTPPDQSTNPGPGPICDPGVQQPPCSSGCFCDDGYVKNRTDNTCIPRDYCRPQPFGARCSAYEDHVPCGGMCDRECVNGYSSYSCPAICRRRCCRRRRLVA